MKENVYKSNFKQKKPFKLKKKNKKKLKGNQLLLPS